MGIQIASESLGRIVFSGISGQYIVLRVEHLVANKIVHCRIVSQIVFLRSDQQEPSFAATRRVPGQVVPHPTDGKTSGIVVASRVLLQFVPRTPRAKTRQVLTGDYLTHFMVSVLKQRNSTTALGNCAVTHLLAFDSHHYAENVGIVTRHRVTG